MKIHEKIEETLVVILIDCVATHNSINQKLVEELPLPLSDTTNYGVIMGSGEAIKGKGICRSVVVVLPKMLVTEDFLPFNLGNLDLVFGMQWLSKQGEMRVHGDKLRMTFNVSGTEVVIKGDPSLTRLEVSLKNPYPVLAGERSGLRREV